MTSIIINSFYRALCNINDYTPIKDMDMKKLAVTLVDALYPEDGYITLEDDPRGSLRVHLDDSFLNRVRDQIAKGLELKEATEAAGFKAQEPIKQEVVVPIAAPEVKEVKVKPAPKPKAAPKPKLTPEEEAAAKAEKEAKAAEEKAAKEAKVAADKAAKEAAKAAEKAAKAAEKAAPKPKFVGNIEKLNPTQEKSWKKAAADAKVELTDDHKKRFLAQLNALDNKVYNLKKLEVHMTEFFAPKEPETKDVELTEVEYNEKAYLVSDDGDVYQETVLESGETITKKVGHVGMLEFKDMQQPTE
jgi:hypothetical protein